MRKIDEKSIYTKINSSQKRKRFSKKRKVKRVKIDW